MGGSWQTKYNPYLRVLSEAVYFHNINQELRKDPELEKIQLLELLYAGWLNDGEGVHVRICQDQTFCSERQHQQ